MSGADVRVIADVLWRLANDPALAGEFVIVEADGHAGYVQFLGDESGIHAEAVSNAHLEPPDQLDAHQMRRLAELGWSEPAEGMPNWFRRVEAPALSGFEAIARLAWRTLTEVYGVPSGQPLTVNCSWGESLAVSGAPEEERWGAS